MQISLSIEFSIVHYFMLFLHKTERGSITQETGTMNNWWKKADPRNHVETGVGQHYSSP